jgi:hypothetical protein
MSDYRIDITGIADVLPWLLTGAAGMLGRIVYHARLVQRGVRKPLSWVLLWDIPIALCMGWVALGMGTWLDTKWEVTISIALVISYLGPHVIDILFVKWSDYKFGGKDDGKTS